MRKTTSFLLLVAMASCGGTSVPVVLSSAGSGGSGSGTAPSSALYTEPAVAPIAVDTGPDTSFASLLNNVRTENGANEVVHNAQLDLTAQAHAQDMIDNDYFSHTGLNGSTPGDRATLAGYDWQTYGENIASGYRSEEGVMSGWTNSSGHHANNINPNFKEFGLGVAQDGRETRWVLMLGAR